MAWFRPTRLPAALLAALVAAFALVGVSAGPAVAHAALVATTPAAGAAVEQAPATVTVRFGESVQAASDAIRVLDAEGTRVDEGDAATVPGHPDTVAASLRPGLGKGTYTVAWRITSADSHPVHGAFAFSVGQSATAAVPLAGADRGADPAVAALVHIARGAGYLGLALLVGAAGAGLLLDGPAGRAALRTQTCTGGVVLTLSAALGLLAQGPYAAGDGLGSLLDPDLLHTTLSGRTGVVEAVRVALAAVITLPLALTGQSAPRPAAKATSSLAASASGPSAPVSSPAAGTAAVGSPNLGSGEPSSLGVSAPGTSTPASPQAAGSPDVGTGTVSSSAAGSPEVVGPNIGSQGAGSPMVQSDAGSPAVSAPGASASASPQDAGSPNLVVGAISSPPVSASGASAPVSSAAGPSDARSSAAGFAGGGNSNVVASAGGSTGVGTSGVRTGAASAPGDAGPDAGASGVGTRAPSAWGVAARLGVALASRGGPLGRAGSYGRFVLLIALAGTFSATGHSVAGRYVPFAFAADVLHLVAMGLWLGGLVALAVLCSGRGVPAGVGDFTGAVRRFSPLAAWCVGVLAVTGTLQSLRQLTSVSDLLSTGWGRYLLVKLAVVLGVLALAYRARRWTHRHAASRTEPPYEPAPATLRTMRRTLVYEASVGVVVLALSAMLAGSAPPSDRAPGTTSAPRATAASPAHLHATYDTGSTGGSGTATALLTPAANGAVTVAVTLTTSASTPADPAELTASLTLPALHIGPLPLDLTPTTPGHWTGTATLTPKGDWQLALTIRTSDIDEATVTFPPTPL